ncbi:hypothetical protein CNY67_05140 [Desulfovibrio sp. G11]|nr:hypothetical protein CNY67_05140 [Desulfovibrio sp. G11]
MPCASGRQARHISSSGPLSARVNWFSFQLFSSERVLLLRLSAQENHDVLPDAVKQLTPLGAVFRYHFCAFSRRFS